MKYFTLKIEDPTTVTTTTFVDGTDMPMHEYKVSAVKLYRMMTNGWLKTCKQEIEKVLAGEVVYMKDLRDQYDNDNPAVIPEFMVRFRDIGFIMEGPVFEHEIRTEIKYHIDANKLDEAIKLLEIIKPL